MTRFVVLRPEPGNAATCARLRDQGLEALALPLFAVVPVAWTLPDLARFDAVLLTSANAVRHGALPDALKRLPVVAVGEATAAAARSAGFDVAITGTGDARSAVDQARTKNLARLLHLAGRERAPTAGNVEAITVYSSDPVRVDDADIRATGAQHVLIHSARAARAFAERVDGAGVDRATIALIVISAAVGTAAGGGWREVIVADQPTDDALVAIAANRAIDPGARRGDKRVMSDQVPIDRSRARGPRLGVIIALIGLAFIAGLVAMGYAFKTVPWLGAQTAALTGSGVKSSAATTGNADYTPAQPLNANGETSAPAAIDTAVLATREATLAGQLSVLETRTAAVSADANSAAAQATRAEGLMVAFAARRAIDRGVGLGYIEEQLRLRFGKAQPRATAAVIQAAHQPVTIEDLRQGLDTIAPDITSTNGVAEGGWLKTVRREFNNLIVLREESMASPMPADRLARARRLLEAGQVEAARAEVARLPGAGQAGNWMAAARRYIIARQALDILENTALMGQAGQPQPSPIIVTTPIVPPTTEQVEDQPAPLTATP